jgi:hypothetical protein
MSLRGCQAPMKQSQPTSVATHRRIPPHLLFSISFPSPCERGVGEVPALLAGRLRAQHRLASWSVPTHPSARTKTRPQLPMLPYLPPLRMSKQLSFLRPRIVPHRILSARIARRDVWATGKTRPAAVLILRRRTARTSPLILPKRSGDQMRGAGAARGGPEHP